MTYEELFDAYRQVVSQRDRLAAVGDRMWGLLARLPDQPWPQPWDDWAEVRGIGGTPPVEDWAEC